MLGRPASWWIRVHRDCHEWRFDGGRAPARRGKDKVIPTGRWCRLEWPGAGGVMRQANPVVEAFHTINDEEARMMAEKIR